MKKRTIFLIIVLILSLVVALFFLTREPVQATDNVDMGYFNKTIAELNTKIDSMQVDIDTLEATNNDLQEQVRLLNSKTASLQTQVNNTINGLSNSNVRISKIEARETKLYETMSNSYYIGYMGVKMRQFVLTQ